MSELAKIRRVPAWMKVLRKPTALKRWIALICPEKEAQRFFLTSYVHLALSV